MIMLFKIEIMRKYLLLSLLIFTYIVNAQDFRKRPNLKDLHARKWEYLVTNANLTDDQAAKIEPLFMEYEKSIWNLMEQNKDAFRKNREEKINQGSLNYEELNDRFVNSELQKAQLQKNFYLKLKKYLPAQSIFEYFNAERSFRKELIKDWQGGRRPMNRP